MSYPFLWKYYDRSINGPSTRSPNSDIAKDGHVYQRFPPFTPRAYYDDKPKDEWFPLYSPHDATDNIQGVTWLTDAYDENLKAANGMTAMTPFGVGDYVAKNALVKDTSAPQTVTGPVDFTGKVTFNGEESTGGGTLATPRNFQFKIGSSSSNVVPFDGTQDVTLSISSIDASYITGGTLPLSVIPQGALERLIRVSTLDDLYSLTQDQVQTGDMVKVGDSSESPVYVVVDDTKLSSSDGYEKFAAGTSTLALQADEFSSARTIALTGDVTGSASSTGQNGWSIATTYTGTLPVSKGGTGASSASAALSNLGLTATATELNYCDGVTGPIQAQIDDKADSGHEHYYAGSASKGGPASKVAGTNSTSNTNRHIWFSDASEEEKRCYNTNFTYNPSTNVVSCDISGKASTADMSNKVANGSTVGSSVKPVYVNAGVITECANSIDAISNEEITSLFSQME